MRLTRSTLLLLALAGCRESVGVRDTGAGSADSEIVAYLRNELRVTAVNTVVQNGGVSTLRTNLSVTNFGSRRIDVVVDQQTWLLSIFDNASLAGTPRWQSDFAAQRNDREQRLQIEPGMTVTTSVMTPLAVAFGGLPAGTYYLSYDLALRPEQRVGPFAAGQIQLPEA